MGNRYAEIAVTAGVKKNQRTFGSRDFYEKFEQGEISNERLTD